MINKEFDNEQELNGFIAWTTHNTSYTWDEIEIQSHNLCQWGWRMVPSWPFSILSNMKLSKRSSTS
jgi:hypothetical protein